MNWDVTWAAVSATAAVLSVAGGTIAWWRSRYSSTAKSDAEDARDYARRTLAALETTANSMQDISSRREQSMNHSPAEPLTLTHVRNSLYRLQNNTDDSVLIEQIDNADRFVRLDLEPGTDIPAYESVEFLIAGAWGKPVPGELVVGLAQADHPTRIAIPPKA